MGNRRRSAAEWAQLVRAWERSGQSREQFARARGVSPATLGWWRWRLAGEPVERKRAAIEPAVGLVPVEIVEDGSRERAHSAAIELTTPDGHAVRVYEPTEETLRVMIEALLHRRGGA